MHQKTLPITKHTEVTEKSPNLSQQVGNIQSLNKKSKNSRKKYLKIRANPEVLRKGSSNLSDSNV